PLEEWREDVAAWVALRADRSPELDHLVDPARTEPYIHGPSAQQYGPGITTAAVLNPGRQRMQTHRHTNIVPCRLIPRSDHIRVVDVGIILVHGHQPHPMRGFITVQPPGADQQ